MPLVIKIVDRMLTRKPNCEPPLTHTDITTILGVQPDKLTADYTALVNEELKKRVQERQQNQQQNPPQNQQQSQQQTQQPVVAPTVAAVAPSQQSARPPVQVSPEDLKYIKDKFEEMKSMYTNTTQLMEVLVKGGKEKEIAMLTTMRALFAAQYETNETTVYVNRVQVDALKEKLHELYMVGQSIVKTVASASTPKAEAPQPPPPAAKQEPVPKVATPKPQPPLAPVAVPSPQPIQPLAQPQPMMQMQQQQMLQQQLPPWPFPQFPLDHAKRAIFLIRSQTTPQGELRVRQQLEAKLSSIQPVLNSIQLEQLVTRYVPNLQAQIQMTLQQQQQINQQQLNQQQQHTQQQFQLQQQHLQLQQLQQFQQLQTANQQQQGLTPQMQLLLQQQQQQQQLLSNLPQVNLPQQPVKQTTTPTTTKPLPTKKGSQKPQDSTQKKGSVSTPSQQLAIAVPPAPVIIPMKAQVTKILAEMSGDSSNKSATWSLFGLHGETTLLEAGQNPDLQGGNLEGVIKGLESVQVDPEFKHWGDDDDEDADEQQDQDVALVLGSDYVVDKSAAWKGLVPFRNIGGLVGGIDEFGTGGGVGRKKVSVEEEVRAIEAKFPQVKGEVLKVSGEGVDETLVVSFSKLSTASGSGAIGNSVDMETFGEAADGGRVVFTISGWGLYEQRQTGGNVVSFSGGVDDVMDVDVDFDGDSYGVVEEGSSSRRMQDVLVALLEV
ncbi:UNVERIFIED_CONTAM: hypothetical protein HDU68_000537 [Siphonaria sp. JEL0065]|nr:hypothetical protein HDU68_000537 [Siphonaria sp. JEL0065]